MSDERKLQRGLSDVSSLFEKRREILPHDSVIKEIIPPRLKGISCVCLWDATASSLSSSVTRWLAYQLAGMKIPTTVLGLQVPADKIESSFSTPATPLNQECLQFISLSPAQWEEISARSGRQFGTLSPEAHSEAIFFDLPSLSTAIPEILYSVLDRMIIVTDESTASLETAYRMIKKIRRASAGAELGFVFKGLQMSSVGEQLYERFSDLVSRHLGTEINWMGYLGYYQEAHVPSLQFTALQAIQGFSRNPGCEKIKEEFVQSLRVILPGVFGSEVHQQGA